MHVFTNFKYLNVYMYIRNPRNIQEYTCLHDCYLMLKCVVVDKHEDKVFSEYLSK